METVLFFADSVSTVYKDCLFSQKNKQTNKANKANKQF